MCRGKLVFVVLVEYWFVHRLMYSVVDLVAKVQKRVETPKFRTSESALSKYKFYFFYTNSTSPKQSLR